MMRTPDEDGAHAVETRLPPADAIIVTDRRHCVTMLNEAAEALTGWRSSNAAGMPLGLVIGDASRSAAPPDGRCTVQSRDGLQHAAVATSSPVRDSLGRIIGTVTVFSIGTSQRFPAQAQAELDLAAPEIELAINALGAGIRERAEEVSALMDVIPVALYLAHDADCTAVTCNRAADELLSPPGGTTDAGLYAHRVFHDGRELGPHEMPIQRAAALGVATDGDEYEIRFENGASKYIYGYARPLFGPDGHTRGSVAAFVDVTERKRSEDALRESEQRFRVLADNVPVMIWVADRDGRLTYFNRTWRDYTGDALAEGETRGWSDCVHPADRIRVRDQLAREFAQRIPVRLEVRLRGSDGSHRWMMNVASPFYRADGAFSGYIGTCSDITAAKLHEERLEQADRRKDEFIATLAHELRNPLAPIRNALHILGSASTDGEGMRWAREVIERQVTQMVRLVDDLLDVARAACGQLELRRETIAIDQVVHDAVEAGTPLLERSGHELHLNLPAPPLMVNGDPARLAEIVINLLNNAAKYTPEGGQVWVAAEREGNYVLVKVRDTGVGISAEALPGIFTMFTQVHTTRDRAQGGLGVGLALARRLAELHGGELTAYSAGLGRGSEFVLKLPAVEARVAEPVRAPYAGDGPAGPGMRVLVVDDSEDAADSLAILLRLSDHTVATARDGPSALEGFAAFGPQVVILDIGLPGMSGYEVAQRIRRLPRGREVTLIALTGWGRDEERARAFASGFDHHLVKPVAVEALQRLLAMQLQS